MKRLLVVSAIAVLGLNSVVLAGGLPEEMPMAPAATTSETGIYFGISGGYGMTHWKNIDGLVEGTDKITISNDNGFVGRAFLGYDINRYFALEGGFTYFFNKAKLLVNNVEASNAKTYAGDIMLKGKLPVVDNFDLYGKVGANLLFTRLSASRSSNSNNTTNFNVAYGAGADYYITPNVIANVEWLRFNGSENTKDLANSKYQPHTDAFLLGLRYKIEL